MVNKFSKLTNSQFRSYTREKQKDNGKKYLKKLLSSIDSVNAVRLESCGQSGSWERIYGGKELWKRCVLVWSGMECG